MYIYRALNEFDEKINPIKNGLIAKSIIGPILYREFLFIAYAMYVREDDNPIFRLSKKEIEQIYRESRKKFEISGHIPEFLEIADKNQGKINEIFNGLITTEDQHYLSNLQDVLLTKNGHITKGSTKDYPWISFTTSLEKVKHYYENQEKNRIVVIDSNIDKFYDIAENEFLVALDLSSKEVIRNNEFLINLNKTRTRLNYRGLNYAINDKEVIYYNRVPKNKILTILDALEYELLSIGFLDESYYKIPELKKYYWKFKVLSSIRKILEDEGDIIKYLVEEYYGKSTSVLSLSTNSKYSPDELSNANQYILSKIKDSDDIKRLIRSR